MATLHDENGGLALRIAFIGRECGDYLLYRMEFLNGGKPVLRQDAFGWNRAEIITEYGLPSLVAFFERMSQGTEPSEESWSDAADEFEHCIAVYAHKPLPFGYGAQLAAEELSEADCYRESVSVIATADINGSHNAPCGSAFILTADFEDFRRFAAQLRTEYEAKKDTVADILDWTAEEAENGESV